MNQNLTYQELSNAELNIKLKELENEYAVLQQKMMHMLNKMEELDKKYISIKEILNKRTKGRKF